MIFVFKLVFKKNIGDKELNWKVFFFENNLLLV